MDALARPVIPPAPKVHARDLPLWRLILATQRNSLGSWPEHAFDDLIARRRVLGREGLLVNDPDGARHVLATAMSKYRRPMILLRTIRPIAGAGVLLSEGGAWRRQRRMLAPVFSPASVDGLLPHFILAAETMVRRLERSPRANLSAVFHDTALDAVLQALFSLPTDEAREGMAATVRGYITGPGAPNLLDEVAASEQDFPWMTGARRRFQALWFGAVDQVIAGRRQAPKAGGPGDLLDLLLAARDADTGEALPDDEIRDQCATMLFAGFETTSRLLFWASYLLTQDPIEQGRLRREIAAFPPERVAGLEDLQHWPRLRQVLLEALRLYPPVPHVIREAVDEDVILGEAVSPGAQVWISPWVMHRHRRFWDRPTAFMPDRFAGQASPWTSGAFMPFGGGPRICIGASFALAEAQIVLATLLSRFEIGLETARPVLPVAKVTIGPNFEPWFGLTPVQG